MVDSRHHFWVRFLTLVNNSTSRLIYLLYRALISIWFVILLFATLVHFWTDTKTDSSNVSELVLALSLQRNARDSMRTKRLEAPSFHAAQGIQVLSVFLLASGYVFYLMMGYLGEFLPIINCKKNQFNDKHDCLFAENPMFAYEFR